MRTLNQDQARRFALAAQGFTRTRPSGRIDVRHFRRVLETIGLLQLDTVNVLVRAHYLPLFSRLGAYDREALDRWTSGSGELFEYWGHAASLMPTALYPQWRWKMEAIATEPWRSVRRILDERPGYIDEVFEEVDRNGPLAAGDFDEAERKKGPWWDWHPGKHALEWLFASGRIAAYRTTNFGRLYDLPERVLPVEVLNGPAPDKTEAHRSLLLDAGRHLGVATLADLADYHRLKVPAARPVLKQLVADAELEAVAVDGWRQPAYLHPEATLPRRASGTALLSPFDSLIFNRDRVERLFDFYYRIEIYVPKPKREYGYYVLPFLLDGRLVARVDLKADRQNGALLVQASYLEPGNDPAAVATPLAGELEEMARWLDLDEVVVRPNGDFASRLAPAIG
jgi:uncharacterized protein YcaQ